MASFLMIFGLIVDICFFIIIAHVVLSWLINFDIVNLRQPVVAQIWHGLNRLTEPVYRPIRRMLPDLGGIDIAPMIALVGLYALQIVVYNNLAPMAYGG
ncbi:MAG: YggT family protein [Paracoccaceae bacterium]|nr:YggT family protein [Paracoccaceae bacterium]